MNLIGKLKNLFTSDPPKPENPSISSLSDGDFNILSTDAQTFSADFAKGYTPSMAENSKFVVADTDDPAYSGYPEDGMGKYVQLDYIINDVASVDFSQSYNPARAEDGKFVHLDLDPSLGWPASNYPKYGVLSYIVNPTWLTNTGGALSGDLDMLGNNIYNVGHIYAVSSTIQYTDIQVYEMSGFEVTGDVTIFGTTTADGFYTIDGNSNQWNSAYSTVNSNSASWAGGSGVTVGLEGQIPFVAAGDADFEYGAMSYSSSTLSVTGDLDMTDGDLNNVGLIQFDITHGVEPAVGHLAWDSDAGTLGLGMVGDNVTLQIGQENVVYVSNKSGADIPNGKLVYATGSQGNRLTIDLADNTDSDKFHILGMTTEDIDDNADGFVTTSGLVRGTGVQPLSTSGFTEGDSLYLNSNGDYTNEHPSSSIVGTVLFGHVVRSHANTGMILMTAPQSFSVGNNFDGTLRQSVVNKNSGVNAAAGFTAVNNANHFTTMGIACTGNTTFQDAGGDPVSVYYSPGYGDHWHAVDGAKDFVWFTDPTDSHNNSALNNEVMRLSSDGTLQLNQYTTNGYMRFVNSDGTVAVDSSLTLPIVSKTANYTVLATDYTILVDASSTAVTITLPASPSEGQLWNIKVKDSTNTVTISPNGNNLDGESSDIALIEDESITVQADNSGDFWIL